MVSQMMGDSEDAEQFAYFGGVLQGEFLKMQIDHYRRRKFGIGGAMFWCFNDAWPAVGYSVVDYYARPKPAYYFIRRAFEPVSLVFAEHEGGIAAWVVNDTLDDVSGSAMLYVSKLTREPVWQTVPVEVPANGVKLLWQAEIAGDRSRQVVLGRLQIDGRQLVRATYILAPPRETDFPAPKVTVQRRYDEQSRTLFLQVESDAFAYALKLTNLPDDARPNDNYFDLAAGEQVLVSIANIGSDDAGSVGVWRPGIKSLRDKSI